MHYYFTLLFLHYYYTYTFYFIVCPSQRLPEYIETKLLAIHIHFILLCVQVKDYQNILKLSCWPLGLTLYKAFSNIKKISGTSLPASFSAWFLKKNFSFLLTDQISLYDCLYFFRYWVICVL